jgi:hypothetical protein
MTTKKLLAVCFGFCVAWVQGVAQVPVAPGAPKVAVTPVAGRVINDAPVVSVFPMEAVKEVVPLLSVDPALVPTTLSVKMRYRAFFGEGKSQIFDVVVPVYYDDSQLMLGAEDRALLIRYGAEMEDILSAFEQLIKRAERVSQGLAAVYARGRPLGVLGSGYKPAQGLSEFPGIRIPAGNFRLGR